MDFKTFYLERHPEVVKYPGDYHELSHVVIERMCETMGAWADSLAGAVLASTPKAEKTHAADWLALTDWYSDPITVKREAIVAVAVADDKFNRDSAHRDVLTLHLRGGAMIHVRSDVGGVEAFREKYL